MTNPFGERRKVRCPPGAGAAIFSTTPLLSQLQKPSLRLAESYPVPWLHFWK